MALDNNTQLVYTDKLTIKNWFKTGLKPKQDQFWAQFDSFWHKSESLPISSISGLGNLLDGKAEANHTHAEYATNDATSLIPQNVTAWQNKLGINDLDYVVIPTEDATENSHPYVVVIDNEGKSALRNATDFRKVDTVDGIEPEENKDVKLGAVRKSESNEVEAGFDLHQKDGAAIGIDTQGLKVSEGGIYSVLKAESISAKNQTPTPAYQFQELLFPRRMAIGTEEKVYPVTYVQGLKADEKGRVDISGVAMNWTNPSQRFSGLTDKSADATFNRLLGMDVSGKLNEVGLYALTSAMAKASDAQKDVWRNASRKSNETTGATVPSITTVNVVGLGNNAGFNYPFSVVGVNLNLVQSVNLIKVKDENGQLIPEESVAIVNFTRNSATMITIEYPNNTFTNGFIVVEFVDSLYYSVRSEEIEVSDEIKPLTPPVVSWTYIGLENRVRDYDIVSGNKITLLNNSIDNNLFTNRCNYETNLFITREMIMSGFEITLKTSFVFKSQAVFIDGYPPIGIYLRTGDDVNFVSLNQEDISQCRYDTALYKINTISRTIYTGGNSGNSIQNYLQQSYIKFKYKNGLLNILIYYEDGTIKNFKMSNYTPPSASLISKGLKVAIDIGGGYTPYRQAILDRSIEIIDFKLM